LIFENGTRRMWCGNMKNIELKLISELMKNSRSSDRELAKKLRVSQPTVTRIRTRLEKEGYIQEYTIIPNFEKLGYEILAFVFAKHRTGLGSAGIKKARAIAQKDFSEKAPPEIILFERGLGLSSDYGAVIVSIHKDYASYKDLISKTKVYDFLDQSLTTSFLVDFKQETHYRPFTFRTLAENILLHSNGKP
jgi:DNA-binding Lrp family transcriptional regulator